MHMIILKMISKLIRILQAGEDPRLIAGGFMLGMILGLLSLKTLFALPVFLLLLLLNVNLAAAVVAVLLFRLIAFIADPLIHGLGYAVLVDFERLRAFWSFLASVRIVPFTRFNNTLVMGGLILSLVLAFPVFWGIKQLIIVYRERYQERVQNWKIIKAIKGTALFRVLFGASRVGG
jgi:uncharacterized protein (TIGR03546 family)